MGWSSSTSPASEDDRPGGSRRSWHLLRRETAWPSPPRAVTMAERLDAPDLVSHCPAHPSSSRWRASRCGFPVEEGPRTLGGVGRPCTALLAPWNRCTVSENPRLWRRIRRRSPCERLVLIPKFFSLCDEVRISAVRSVVFLHRHGLRPMSAKRRCFVGEAAQFFFGSALSAIEPKSVPWRWPRCRRVSPGGVQGIKSAVHQARVMSSDPIATADPPLLRSAIRTGSSAGHGDERIDVGAERPPGHMAVACRPWTSFRRRVKVD